MLRPVARGVSWTRGENLHLTLKFLGEVADEQVKPLCDELRAIVRPGPIEMWAEGLVCFPECGSIRIIGAGLAGPTAALLELVERIEEACARQEFPRERRAYTPHLTLARAKIPLPGGLRGKLAEAVKDHFPGPVMSTSQFVLMQSVLKPAGAEYTPAARF